MDSSKPRIVCVMQLPPPVHGVTLVNDAIARSELLASRFELDIVPLRFADSIDDLGRITPRKLARLVATSAELVRALARKPALAYVSLATTTPAFYRDCAFVTALAAAGVPRVFHVHSDGLAAHPGWLLRWLFSGARVIHLSSGLRTETRGLVPDERVSIVPNGLPATAAVSRIPGKALRILFLSNLLRAKGPLVLLDAIERLAVQGIEVEASFAGAPAGDGGVEELLAGIDRARLADRVRYLGPVYGAAKDALFASHDVLAMPTLRDAFPIVILEAMRAGLPVVATEVGAIPDLVAHEESGLLVPPGDAAALSGALARLATEPELRLRLGRAARVRFEQHFTLDRFEHALANALDQALTDSRRR